MRAPICEALTIRQKNRGKTTTRRKETNEEVMQAALQRYGYLSLRISFSVKDKEAAYRGLKSESLVVRKIPSIPDVQLLVKRLEERIMEFVKGDR